MADTGNIELASDLTAPVFMQRLESLARLTRRLLRDRPRTMKNRQGQSGFEFSEYRPYLPGDDLRQVDWNVYQRLGEVMIKEYTVEIARHWVIGLDTSASMFLYNKFLFARQLTAALVYIALSLLDRVTFFTFPALPLQFSCYHGRRQIKSVLGCLNQLQPQPAAANFQLRSLLARLPQHARAIIISDFYDQGHRRLFPLLQLKDICSVAVHLVAREERQPEWQGVCQMQDAETKMTATIDITPSCRRRYQQNLERHLLQIKSFCHQYQASHLETAPKNSMVKDCLAILRTAGLLR